MEPTIWQVIGTMEGYGNEEVKRLVHTYKAATEEDRVLIVQTWSHLFQQYAEIWKLHQVAKQAESLQCDFNI